MTRRMIIQDSPLTKALDRMQTFFEDQIIAQNQERITQKKEDNNAKIRVLEYLIQENQVEEAGIANKIELLSESYRDRTGSLDGIALEHQSTNSQALLDISAKSTTDMLQLIYEDTRSDIQVNQANLTELKRRNSLLDTFDEYLSMTGVEQGPSKTKVDPADIEMALAAFSTDPNLKERLQEGDMQGFIQGAADLAKTPEAMHDLTTNYYSRKQVDLEAQRLVLAQSQLTIEENIADLTLEDYDLKKSIATHQFNITNSELSRDSMINPFMYKLSGRFQPMTKVQATLGSTEIEDMSDSEIEGLKIKLHDEKLSIAANYMPWIQDEQSAAEGSEGLLDALLSANTKDPILRDASAIIDYLNTANQYYTMSNNEEFRQTIMNDLGIDIADTQRPISQLVALQEQIQDAKFSIGTLSLRMANLSEDDEETKPTSLSTFLSGSANTKPEPPLVPPVIPPSIIDSTIVTPTSSGVENPGIRPMSVIMHKGDSPLYAEWDKYPNEKTDGKGFAPHAISQGKNANIHNYQIWAQLTELGLNPDDYPPGSLNDFLFESK